jgi:hypothetical protein
MQTTDVTPPASAAAEPVLIAVDFEIASIMTIDTCLYIQILIYAFVREGQHGHEQQRKRPPLLRRDGAGRLLIPKGLVAAANLLVKVRVGRRLGYVLQPCREVLSRTHPSSQVLLKAVIEEMRRLMETVDPGDRLRLAALLCQVLPWARTRIVLSGRGKARDELRCSLRQRDHFDVGIALAALQALRPAHADAFIGLICQSVDGLVPAGLRLTATTQLQLQARLDSWYRLPACPDKECAGAGPRRDGYNR